VREVVRLCLYFRRTFGWFFSVTSRYFGRSFGRTFGILGPFIIVNEDVEMINIIVRVELGLVVNGDRIVWFDVERLSGTRTRSV
jgi:hypothetical protein